MKKNDKKVKKVVDKGLSMWYYNSADSERGGEIIRQKNKREKDDELLYAK
jgi:hypothetical protein